MDVIGKQRFDQKLFSMKSSILWIRFGSFDQNWKREREREKETTDKDRLRERKERERERKMQQQFLMKLDDLESGTNKITSLLNRKSEITQTFCHFYGTKAYVGITVL